MQPPNFERVSQTRVQMRETAITIAFTPVCEDVVACPFFMPEERCESDWPFPQRLPLGAGFRGVCHAPGQEGVRPGDDELKSSCNLGYAKKCCRLPAERYADAVRFAMFEQDDGVVQVRYSLELAYLPAGHGELLYRKDTAQWVRKHEDLCIQRMAECYLQVQLERRLRS